MPTRLSRLFYGWRMIAAGCAMRILGGGLHSYGFTVFFLPLSNDLGLSRAATSLAFSLARAEGAFEAPLAGYLIDRFGPRPIMLTALFMSGMGYILLAGVHHYWSFLVVYIGVISVSFSSGFMHSPIVLANSWFIRHRAMAMTLISASMGVGGALISPLLALGVEAWGWRPTAVVSGLCMIVIGMPLASTVRRSPEVMGLLPDGDLPHRSEEGRAPRTGKPPRVQQETIFTVSQAMRTSAFWLIVAATLLRVAGYSAMMVHFIPLLVWKGLTQQGAALLLAGYAVLSLPSHLLVGWLAGRMDKPRLMALAMLVSTGSVIVLILGKDEAAFWLFTALFTATESIFPVTWAAVGDFFGRKYFGTIRGSMNFFNTWGSVLGPVAAGAVYDRSASYDALLWAVVGLYLGAALFYALLSGPEGPAAEKTVEAGG